MKKLAMGSIVLYRGDMGVIISDVNVVSDSLTFVPIVKEDIVKHVLSSWVKVEAQTDLGQISGYACTDLFICIDNNIVVIGDLHESYLMEIAKNLRANFPTCPFDGLEGVL